MASTTERTAEIRQALKARNITSRQVSVRADYYSMGSSINVLIKDPRVSLKLVKSIAEPHERIDRDGYGEILSGGNRFVHVSYTREAREALAVPYLPSLEAARAQLDTASQNTLIEIDGTPFMLGRDSHHGNAFSLWSESGHLQNAYDLASLASEVGQRMIEGGR